jgi:seryl-tRNA synthetase
MTLICLFLFFHLSVIGLVELKLDAMEVINDTNENKKQTAEKEEVQAAKAALDAKLDTVGNLIHESVPVSNDEVFFD